MFDVGFLEILVIGIVSLVVIGPERLPDVARTVGRWVGKMRRFVQGVRTDFASELESGDLKKLLGDQREQIDELRKLVNTTQAELRETANEVSRTTTESMQALDKELKDSANTEADDKPAASIGQKADDSPPN